MWISIFLAFIVTRLVLFCIGMIAQSNIPAESYQTWKQQTLEVQHPYLSMWAVWDSKWYLQIANSGYRDDATVFNPNIYSSVGFFPLYSTLVFLVSWVVGDTLVAGILISNIFLVASAFLLYLLVKGDGNESAAKRSIWYLFLFPSAYIFSAVYPESLLLFLWLGSIFSAQKRKWVWVGVFGFFAAMTKPVGFLIIIPLLVMYLESIEEKWKRIRPSVLSLALIPFGLIFVACLQYLVTGDLFAYSHVQQAAWGHYLANPLRILFTRLNGPFYSFFNATTVLSFLVVILGGVKKIKPAYWFFALALLLFIPMNGDVNGVWRYLASVFPFVILFSTWGASENFDRIFMMSMSLLQGCLFVFWVLGYWFVS